MRSGAIISGGCLEDGVLYRNLTQPRTRTNLDIWPRVPRGRNGSGRRFGGVFGVEEAPPSPPDPPVNQVNVMGMFPDWTCVEWCRCQSAV